MILFTMSKWFNRERQCSTDLLKIRFSGDDIKETEKGIYELKVFGNKLENLRASIRKEIKEKKKGIFNCGNIRP